MNITIKRITSALLFVALVSCGNAKREKEASALKEKEWLNEKEPGRKVTEHNRRKISKAEAIGLAEKQFEQYLPEILASHDAILDIQEAYTGDFTGDGTEDVAIYFSLAPVGGGNAIVGQGLTLYRNTGYSVKVIAGYDPDYLFRFDKISKGKIYVEKMEYAENDGRCCPSIRTEHILTITGSRAY